MRGLEPLAAYDHNQIRDMISEIGRLRGSVSKTEYKMNRYILDAVWKESEKVAPSFVFEVQISGNLYQAMIKLKEAWDSWHSKLFLVTAGEQKEEAEELAQRAFHQIKEEMKIIDCSLIQELYKVEKEAYDLRVEAGIQKPLPTVAIPAKKMIKRPRKPEIYTLEERLKGKSPEIRSAFNKLREEILRLTEGIEEKVTKHWVSYKYKKTFAMLRIGKEKIRVFIKIDESKLKDPKKWVRKMKFAPPHYFDISTLDQFEYAMNLIKQAL